MGLTPQGPAGEKAKAALLWVIVGVVVIVVLISMYNGFKLFSGLSSGWHNMLQGLGLERDDEEKKIDEDAANANNIAQQTNSPFNPTFYKSSPAGTPLLTSAKAIELVGEIWDSVGFIYDNSDQMLAAIKQCNSWAKVSQLADMFNTKKGRDMYAWLKDKMDSDSQRENLNKAVQYAFSLPKYK